MPTGYTAGILDGKINTFEEFAKTCIRAFGASIHMRDDSLNTEYTPIKYDESYDQTIAELKEELMIFNSLTDDEIIQNHVEKILIRIKDATYNMIKNKNIKLKLESLLNEVNEYIPPTVDHVNFKNFMIEQLKTTIEHDCSNYDENRLHDCYVSLNDIDVEKIKFEKVSELNRQIGFYNELRNKNIAQVDKSNKWVADVLFSLLPRETI